MNITRYSYKTSSAAAKSGPGLLFSVVLTAGSDAATVTIYDNTAGSGTVAVALKAAASTTASWSPSQPVEMSTGIYVTLAGTGPVATVSYQ